MTVLHQQLVFVVAGASCAVPIERVQEITEVRPITPVPAAPPSVRGVTNLRGSVLPVIDLAVLFSKPPTEPSKFACFVVVHLQSASGPMTIALLANSVSDVIDLPPERIEPPPAFGAGLRVDYLRGVAVVANVVTLLLELDRLLTVGELTAAAEVHDWAAREAAKSGAGRPGGDGR